MKHIFIVTGIVSVFTFTACQKDTITSNRIDNYHDYSNHPKDSAYLAVVKKSYDNGLPGVSALVYTPNDGLWEGSAGYASIEDNVPMTPSHIQYAASIPKSFTSIAVLQLIESGKLGLDDHIAEYLDEDVKKNISNCDKITIHQLLNHTSGIPECIDIEFITSFFNDPSYYYSLKECLAFLKGKKALWDPGTDYSYSDANFILLVLIIDKIAGDHTTIFREKMFQPLGLENTYYSYSINHNTVENLVSGYWDIYADGHLENITEWEDALTSYLKGDGGMATNCYDLSLFIQGVFNGLLVSDDNIEKILSDTVHNPHADEWINDSYSLGFMVIHNGYGTWYGHAGMDPGAASFVFYNVEHNVTIAAMTNIGTFFSKRYTKKLYHDLWIDLCKEAFKYHCM